MFINFTAIKPFNNKRSDNESKQYVTSAVPTPACDCFICSSQHPTDPVYKSDDSFPRPTTPVIIEHFGDDETSNYTTDEDFISTPAPTAVPQFRYVPTVAPTFVPVMTEPPERYVTPTCTPLFDEE